MDQIWDRNPSKSEVIGRCGGDENLRMITQDRHKPNAKNKNKKQHQHCISLKSFISKCYIVARVTYLVC